MPNDILRGGNHLRGDLPKNLCLSLSYVSNILAPESSEILNTFVSQKLKLFLQHIPNQATMSVFQFSKLSPLLRT